MSSVAPVAHALETFAARMVPRVLSQISRDPGSATYGCCDRNWWHYKIRDFPSLILQQAGYTAWLAGRLPEWAPEQEGLTKLAEASVRFWNARAVRRGAFEEYYPWEQGYPPLAFSTLAVMKLVDAGVVERALVEPGARVAAAQLSYRFEARAANQQAAGLAALALLRKAYPHLVVGKRFDAVRDATLALQHPEGWFVEYGGPDLGYLAVTIDCLWDLYDATADRRFVEAAERALRFIARLVVPMGGCIGIHNARNTDYLVPYGLARFAAEGGATGEIARQVLDAAFATVERPTHFLHAIDDRYLSHYTGHSILRAVLALRDAPVERPTPDGPEQAATLSTVLPGCGYWLEVSPARRLLVSLRKGGAVTAQWPRGSVADCGWIVRIGRRVYVSHWWSDDWTSEATSDGYLVAGPLVPHTEYLSTPGAHLLLRAASLVVGRHLIGSLKRRLIFQQRRAPFQLQRRIVCQPERIVLFDEISGLPDGAIVTPAPRSSKRHVASADSYHGEDLGLVRGATVERVTRLEGGRFTAETRYMGSDLECLVSS